MKIKPTPIKEPKTIPKHSQLSSLNSSIIQIKKEDSKHTKLSTNITASSFHVNATNKKPTKQKKSQPQQKQKKQKTIRNTQIGTSSRGQPLKQKIKNKKSCDFQFSSKRVSNFMQDEGSVSYREYCLVEDYFVPIVSKNQQQKLQEIMQSTADTSQMFEDFNRNTFRNVFPFKLRDSSNTHHKLAKSGEISRISQIEENIFVKKDKKVSRRQVQIDASPFYEQVGIQYSQRPQFMSAKNLVQTRKQKQKEQQLVAKVQIDIQTDCIAEDQLQQNHSPVKNLQSFDTQGQKQEQKCPQTSQSLSDLLIKLQFKHLHNEKALEIMSRQEKQHYSQLLNSLIEKLNCSPRQKQKQPQAIKSKQMIEFQQVKIVPFEQIKLKYEKLEMEIIRRESYQMSWMQRFVNLPQQAFQTTMLAVSSFMLNFFCYIQLNYLDEFLQNIKVQYGPSYLAQYMRVTRGITNTPALNKKVIDSALFDQYCEELEEIEPLQKTHLRAVFDFINHLLDTYRPSYRHGGEPFPWALKPYTSICQYIIDESSLEIIFLQLKENVQKALSMLCGLIVDEKLYKDISQINPLALKRNQKENQFIDTWLKQDTDEGHQLECQVTKVFYDVSEQIYNMLLLQILEQSPLNKSL